MANDMDSSELTLDPENWGELRKLAHRMLDDMMGHERHFCPFFYLQQQILV
jgi:hypothetical protein